MDYKLNKDLIFQKFNDKITIFDSEKSLLMTLNETASYLLSKVKLRHNTKKLIIDYSIKYKITVKRAKIDIEEFIKELSDKKIIISIKSRNKS